MSLNTDFSKFYYIYEHYIDNNLFYIGKGCYGRAYDFTRRSDQWLDRVNNREKDVKVKIIAHFPEECDAFMFEKMWIEKCSQNGGQLENVRYVNTENKKPKNKLLHKKRKIVKESNISVPEVKEETQVDWEAQRKLLVSNLEVLKQFKKINGRPYKNISGSFDVLELLNLLAIEHIDNNTAVMSNNGCVSYFISRQHILKKLNKSICSTSSVTRKLVVLAYHKFLNKLHDSEINKKHFRKSQHLSAKCNSLKRVTWIEIPIYTTELQKEIEEQAEKWKENGYTSKGISREMFLRTEGLEVANRIYPQYEKITKKVDGTTQIVDRTTTEFSDNLTNEIVIVIMKDIKRLGYSTESNVVDALSNKYSKGIIESQIKKSFKEMLDCYGLTKIRANKKLKEKFKIVSKGYPAIFIKDK